MQEQGDDSFLQGLLGHELDLLFELPFYLFVEAFDARDPVRDDHPHVLEAPALERLEKLGVGLGRLLGRYRIAEDRLPLDRPPPQRGVCRVRIQAKYLRRHPHFAESPDVFHDRVRHARYVRSRHAGVVY